MAVRWQTKGGVQGRVPCEAARIAPLRCEGWQPAAQVLLPAFSRERRKSLRSFVVPIPGPLALWTRTAWIQASGICFVLASPCGAGEGVGPTPKATVTTRSTRRVAHGCQTPRTGSTWVTLRHLQPGGPGSQGAFHTVERLILLFQRLPHDLNWIARPFGPGPLRVRHGVGNGVASTDLLVPCQRLQAHQVALAEGFAAQLF